MRTYHLEAILQFLENAAVEGETRISIGEDSYMPVVLLREAHGEIERIDSMIEVLHEYNTRLRTDYDANSFGERMREYCFDCSPEEYGCYSCFEVNPEFARVGIGSEAGRMVIEAIVGDSCCEEFANDVIAKGRFYSNGDIHFGWYWDGDGSLAFIEGDKCAVSSDCKKDYDWHWRTVESLENGVETKP